MSNPASPIRPDQLLLDSEHRLVTDAQITQWNAGGGGTILEPILPISLYSGGNFGGSDPYTTTPFTLSYPPIIPSYATSVILGVGLKTSSSSSANMYISKAPSLPSRLATVSYSPNNSDDACGNYNEIEIPYHSDRNFLISLSHSGNAPSGWIIQVLGYRRSTVIDALALSNTNPLADGTASPGSSLYVSRADHVHPDKSSSNEHVRLGGNLIMQWGSLTNILLEQSTWYSVTFPYPLDAAPYNIDTQLVFNSLMNGTISLKVRNITNLGFEIGGENSEYSYYGDIMWKAIGPKAV